MTQPSAQAPSPGSPRRTSKAALFSLIFGILGCIPFVTGVLALLFGLFGFAVTGRPEMKGRWMAVIGILLSLLSLSAWTVFGGAVYAAVTGTKAIVASYNAPAEGTKDFIRLLANGDPIGASTHASMSDADLKSAEAIIKVQGSYIDSTFSGGPNEGGSAHIEGTATFSKGLLHVKADLVQSAGTWRITSVELLP